MSMLISSPSWTRAISAAGRRLRGDVADGQAGGAAGEAAVGDQRARLAQAAALEERRRVEHLLHARAALRALVADDHDVARLDPGRGCSRPPLPATRRPPPGPRTSRSTRPRRPSSPRSRRRPGCRSGPPGRRRRCTRAPDRGCSRRPRPCRACPSAPTASTPSPPLAARRRVPQLDGLGRRRAAAEVPARATRRVECAVHGVHVLVGAARPGRSSPRIAGMPPARCTSSMWYVAVRRSGHLGQARHPAGHRVDVVEAEVDLGLAGGGEQVQDRVRRAAHRDVQRHRVLERLAGGDGPRQHRSSSLLVVPLVICTTVSPAFSYNAFRGAAQPRAYSGAIFRRPPGENGTCTAIPARGRRCGRNAACRDASRFRRRRHIPCRGPARFASAARHGLRDPEVADDPGGFNVQEFRSNVVFRWEYRRGPRSSWSGVRGGR